MNKKSETELRARVARLEEWVKAVLDSIDPYFENDEYMDCLKVLNETPQQSLAEIEAAAVEKYFTKLQKEYEPYGLLETYTAFDVARHIEAQGKHFAEQIRQQATG